MGRATLPIPCRAIFAWRTWRFAADGLRILFFSASGAQQTYTNNAAAIYVEKAENLLIRNCVLRDSGNGLFIGSGQSFASRDVQIEGNYIFDNGIEGSIYQHNNYTAAQDIVFEFNRFGPLRAGCLGNNLKDRSAGLIVRYNWIEGGNRQLDLVDGEDSPLIRNDPDYATTHVYGNVLIETEGSGNRQIIHYGGDSGNTSAYRKGLSIYITIPSYRIEATGRLWFGFPRTKKTATWSTTSSMPKLVVPRWRCSMGPERWI